MLVLSWPAVLLVYATGFLVTACVLFFARKREPAPVLLLTAIFWPMALLQLATWATVRGFRRLVGAGARRPPK
jgi:hypothetical protein